MKADELEPQFQNPNKDVLQQRQIYNSRKPVVTLLALNKLKKMRAAKDLENLMRADFLQIIYSPEEQSGGGGVGL